MRYVAPGVVPGLGVQLGETSTALDEVMSRDDATTVMADCLVDEMDGDVGRAFESVMKVRDSMDEVARELMRRM
jgi:hypothetical protein